MSAARLAPQHADGIRRLLDDGALGASGEAHQPLVGVALDLRAVGWGGERVYPRRVERPTRRHLAYTPAPTPASMKSKTHALRSPRTGSVW